MIIKYPGLKQLIVTAFSFRNCLQNLRTTVTTIAIIYPAHAIFAQAVTGDSSQLPRSLITRFFNRQANVRYIYQVTLNPAASAIAWNAEDAGGHPVIYRAPLTHPDQLTRVSAALLPDSAGVSETEPAWSPNGREIAFLSDAHSHGQAQVYIVSATRAHQQEPGPLTQFDGHVSNLQWSPDGKYLSVLYVEKSTREPSPMAAEDRATGLIDSQINRNVQRLAVINRQTGEMRQVSPPGLYIFEYDWSPDNRQFVYSAAPAPGDDNWYIARLYLQSAVMMDTVLLYTPLRQIALPRWSPNGKRIAFIEGLMSDRGGTGGELYTIPSTGGNILQNVTPGRRATPSWFTWQSDNSILFSEFTSGSVAINSVNLLKATIKNLWNADESIRSGSEEMSLCVSGSKTSPTLAFIRSSWNRLPEAWSGKLNKLKQITHLNDGVG
jgi:hypothetical protein